MGGAERRRRAAERGGKEVPSVPGTEKPVAGEDSEDAEGERCEVWRLEAPEQVHTAPRGEERGEEYQDSRRGCHQVMSPDPSHKEEVGDAEDDDTEVHHRLRVHRGKARQRVIRELPERHDMLVVGSGDVFPEARPATHHAGELELVPVRHIDAELKDEDCGEEREQEGVQPQDTVHVSACPRMRRTAAQSRLHGRALPTGISEP